MGHNDTTALGADIATGEAAHGDDAAAAHAAQAARQRLLELRLKQQGAAGVIVRRDTTQPVPLSFAQEGLWLLDQIAGPDGSYNIVRALQLSGELDLSALLAAVCGLVQRHESLRTAFVPHQASARQDVMPAQQAALALSLRPEVLGAGETLPQWLERTAAEPFDLTRAPLLRARLLRLDARDHVLMIALHHIVADGWSVDVLTRELAALYAAGVDRRTASLPPLPIQYADYACWQRERLRGERTKRDLAYWRARLAGLQALELPIDRARPQLGTRRGAVLRFEIETVLLADLDTLARRGNATLFMLLLAAWQVLLARCSGQLDVAVGAPVAARIRPELEPLIGYFVNTLVLRTDLSDNPTFTTLLGRVRETCLDAFAHQELPFEHLVAELAPQREAGRNPLYQVCFALQNMPAAAPALGSRLRVERLPLHNGSAKFDLSLTLAHHAGALAGTLEYSTDLFEPATAARLVRNYTQLLRSLATAPDTPIQQLSLLDAAERAQVLQSWNDTTRPFPCELNLHQLFETQVQRAPRACALLLPDGRTLDYGALNARANRLARKLRAGGVGPDVRVGLCLPSGSASMIVAMLAVLKAGGAYVPLDPQYPADRLAFMQGDSACALLLTTATLRGSLPVTATPVLLVSPEGDVERPDDGGPSATPGEVAHDDLPPLAGPRHLAYVIYTSGSTGTPKGVAVEQIAVARLVLGTDYLQLGPNDVVAQASSASFDAATFEIWGALLNGARLALLDKADLLDPAAMRRCIDTHRINTMFLTTALFNEIAARSPALFGRLDHVLFGGEAVDAVAVRRVMQSAPPKRLLHVYGPTETTTFATWHEVTRDEAACATAVPIGRPIANTHCHLLDARREPVPPGIVGEIYIGGEGLARGYLNRPESTAERFVPDPFRPGDRLYRSGDLARRRDDGEIVFVRRIDRQVKLRGHRIELGEVEAVLARAPGVGQCVADVREIAPGDQRLVAYVVPAADAAAEARSSAALLERLARHLPPFMVPSAVVMLDALPLNRNSKLDRAALPLPGQQGPSAHGTLHDTPTDPLECELLAVWAEVLGTHHIGLDDSFFELGGHSLLAIKLLHAVEQRFGRSLGLATLFEGPTVRRQAALLRSGDPEQRPAGCAVAVQPHGGRPPLFFVSGFGGAILPFHALAQQLGDEQPLFVLDINSLGELGAVRPSLADIAAQMVADLRRVQPQGPYHLAGFSLGGKIVYEIAQQLRRAGCSVGLLALLDCAAPGFPRQRSFPVRALAHIRHAFSQEPRHAPAYLLERVRRLKKYIGLADRVDRSVFKSGDATDPSAGIVQAIEARAAPIYEAWAHYDPTFYPGRMTLVRAARRVHRPGVIDDDPQMGWGPLIGGGIDVTPALPCGHVEMLDADHAPALAALLRERLPNALTGER